MHRSRLTQILIDCNEGAYEKSIAFWSAALGLEPVKDDDRYTVLEGGAGPRVLVQSVPGEAEYHVDIETDDVEAEVARLEKLGAVRKYKIHTWWVMRAPSGHDFCVIRPQTPDFPDAAAKTWGE
ncbi:MAG TPA: VOC family protein [Kofleriaceae bacterium]|nr:VOC family protein [Kofleriaceae bacterium]